MGIAALFFCAAMPARALDDGLAWQLFAEGQYRYARREALRQLEAEPDRFADRYVAASSALRLDAADAQGAQELDELVRADPPMPWAALAALERGRLHALRKEPDEAVSRFAQAFFQAPNDAVFQCAAQALRRLFDEHKVLKKRHSSLARQARSARVAAHGSACAVCSAVPAGGRRSDGHPLLWIVRFYRRQVRPAIGDRCVIEPSCSEYFAQASRAHGWWSIPLIADRFVREPGVSYRAERPVVVGGRVRYADPLEDHVFWLGRRRRDRSAALRCARRTMP